MLALLLILTPDFLSILYFLLVECEVLLKNNLALVGLILFFKL
ncbi:Uncharacterised protein [Serratia marcescens]|nr:Uncharacterised protein [Serratia marcescens]CVF38767.1 Uncharacterised protein [Serratia marcescens]CVH67598.1 Uncharacterised protein [Serratia marcescens]